MTARLATMTPRVETPPDGEITRHRDPPVARQLALHPGEMYRIAYTVGGFGSRRVTRSIAVYGGWSQRRLWDGGTVACLDFALPHGRRLLLLGSQLVDARPAALNEHGQWILQAPQERHRRASRAEVRSESVPEPGPDHEGRDQI